MTFTPPVVLRGRLLERFRQAALPARGGPALTAEELEELGLVTHIGDGCLSVQEALECVYLAELDLSGLRSVTSVGSKFLNGCGGLTAINLSGLRDVTQVGDQFLGNCCGLTELDLSPLRNVTSIGECFLYGCSGLMKLAETPLAKKLGWDGDIRDVLAQLLVEFNVKLKLSWPVRKIALLIRNFAPRDHASDAFKIWSVMRCVVRLLSPLRVPDAVLIGEEQRMLDVVGARSVK